MLRVFKRILLLLMIKGNILFILLHTLFSSCNLFAQERQKHEVIGAYVYNFAKNIQWENEDNISELLFLIISDDQEIINEFHKLSRTRTIRNKPVKVTVSKSIQSADNIHLLFLGKEKEELLPRVFDKIEGKNILLVSDGFADKRLIMINFMETEDKKIQFEINKANIINQNLTIMPDIVLLGGTEIDVAKLYRESQVSLRGMQKEIEKLENDLSNLQRLIDNRNREITQQQEIINKQAEEISARQKQLMNQRAKLQGLFQSVKSQQDTLKQQAALLKQREQELSEKSEQIQKSNEVLTSQRTTISEQTTRIKTQQKTLEEQGSVISTQQYMIYLLGVITALILILIITIYRGYKNKQKVNKLLEEEITVRMRTEAALNIRTNELARSNDELSQFAYVASHDLQEPLRMVTSYMQLVDTRYTKKLDDDAREFIGFAVDGAKRMQVLINDLLTYSRIGTKGQSFQSTDCEQLLHTVMSNLQVAIRESNAQITHDPLPTVMGDATQLMQLFQNLFSNALKFRRDEPPKIHVHAKKKNGLWRLSVQDNGIGIEPQYFDRIFVVFQRLHSRASYSGTGIGLAICKKIVERHGGTIWVESEFGKGATFHFTISEKTVVGHREDPVGKNTRF